MRKVRDPKVFCIGLDSATFDLVAPWAAQGILPNFARLMEEGAFGELESVKPPFSAQAWSSFMTGKNPGKHGVFGFKGFDERTRGLPFCLSHSIRSRTIWNVLGEHGRRVICINMPMTYPPMKVNGLMISGRGTPGVYSDFTYPPHLKGEITALTEGKYIIDLHWSGYLTSRRKSGAALKELFSMIEQRSTVTRHLMRTQPWDLFVVVFMAIDQVQHYFWKLMDPSHPQYSEGEVKAVGNPILEVYQRLDEEIGSIRRELNDDTTLVVFSDHGAGPLREEAIHLNEWLRRRGLFIPLGGDGHRGRELHSVYRAFLKGMWHFLSRHTSTAVKDHLVRLLPGLRAKVSALVSLPSVDWSGTKAFLGENVGTIRINRDLVTEDEEYRRLCQFLASELEGLVNPFTGERIIDKVHHREELYSGSYVSLAPDLLVETRDNAYLIEKGLVSKSEEVVTKARQWRGISGDHRCNGILLMAGEPINRGRRIEGASLLDLAPTILALLNLEILDDMDGRVLTSALAHDFLASHPPKFRRVAEGWKEDRMAETYSDREAREITGRLRDLGYIE